MGTMQVVEGLLETQKVGGVEVIFTIWVLANLVKRKLG